MTNSVRIEVAKNGFIVKRWVPAKKAELYEDEEVFVAEDKAKALEKAGEWLDDK